MTKDEHHTRAMLLGLEYDYRTNAYFSIHVDNIREIDADTLEPCDQNEVRRRMAEWDKTCTDPKEKFNI